MQSDLSESLKLIPQPKEENEKAEIPATASPINQCRATIDELSMVADKVTKLTRDT
jgi:hypothetical protein